jgi:hypothetical protein
LRPHRMLDAKLSSRIVSVLIRTLTAESQSTRNA